MPPKKDTGKITTTDERKKERIKKRNRPNYNDKNFEQAPPIVREANDYIRDFSSLSIDKNPVKPKTNTKKSSKINNIELINKGTVYKYTDEEGNTKVRSCTSKSIDTKKLQEMIKERDNTSK
jgi:hypothetical protein